MVWKVKVKGFPLAREAVGFKFSCSWGCFGRFRLNASSLAREVPRLKFGASG